MNRRSTGNNPSFLRFLSAAALTAILCGCAPPAANFSDTLTFAGPGTEPDTLNPLITQMADTADLALLYMPVLLETDNRGRLIPEIASTVPSRSNGGISADGLTIVYRLRTGVVWQDGVALTAKDVVFTYNAIMNPRNNVATRSGYDRIAGVTSPDAHTVVVRLKQPYAPILSLFGNYPAYPILPAHILSRYASLNSVPFNGAPVGAGPYIVRDWQRGDHLTFVANLKYWRGRPRLARMTFRFIPQAATAAAQLRSGELGAWFNADPAAYPELASARRVRLRTSPINDIHMILVNLRDPVLKDVRIRRALAAAIDRARIIHTAIHGMGTLLDADQPTFSWAYARVHTPITYDPARSKALLDAAGWRTGQGGARYRNGKRLELQFTGTEDVTAWHTVAVLVQAQLRSVGIDVTLKTYPANLYFADASAGGVLRSGHFQLAYDATLLGADPNDQQYFGCDQFTPRGNNTVHWCDAIAERAIQSALATYDLRQRARYYAIVQNRIAREIPIIPLWEVQRYDAFSTLLRRFDPSTAGPTFWNAWSWQTSSYR